MTNPQRGDVTIQGPEGKSYNMCLTLGAIAQIEDQLGLESLVDIDQVMQKPSMKHLLTIFVALLNGGGDKSITKDDMIDWDIGFKDLMSKIRDTFEAAGFHDSDEEEGQQGK